MGSTAIPDRPALRAPLALPVPRARLESMVKMGSPEIKVHRARVVRLEPLVPLARPGSMVKMEIQVHQVLPALRAQLAPRGQPALLASTVRMESPARLASRVSRVLPEPWVLRARWGPPGSTVKTE